MQECYIDSYNILYKAIMLAIQKDDVVSMDKTIDLIIVLVDLIDSDKVYPADEFFIRLKIATDLFHAEKCMAKFDHIKHSAYFIYTRKKDVIRYLYFNGIISEEKHNIALAGKPIYI